MICSKCGVTEHPEFYINQEVLEQNQLCHSCNFWKEIHEEDARLDPHEWCVVNGTHYRLLPSVSNKKLSGFAGRKFHIIFSDGYECDCDNVWCQGDIPEHYKCVFHDNAKFE